MKPHGCLTAKSGTGKRICISMTCLPELQPTAFLRGQPRPECSPGRRPKFPRCTTAGFLADRPQANATSPPSSSSAVRPPWAIGASLCRIGSHFSSGGRLLDLDYRAIDLARPVAQELGLACARHADHHRFSRKDDCRPADAPGQRELSGAIERRRPLDAHGHRRH